MSVLGIVLTAFLASGVEGVEALTIVLAAGVTREWRSTLIGVGAAVAVLCAFVAALGPAIGQVPLDGLRVVVGGLLLAFGLQWLRKAVLRAAGYKAKHDEDAIFVRETAAARRARSAGPAGMDWYAFTLAFKGVLLEGLEVVFIVISIGGGAHHLLAAVAGAGAAVRRRAGRRPRLHRPLSRVPENTTKFVVGVMLTAFGTFWGGEGAGVHWPGADAALPVLVVLYALVAAVAVDALRRTHSGRRPPAPPPLPPPTPLPPAWACPGRDAAAADGGAGRAGLRRVRLGLRRRRRLDRRPRRDRAARPGPAHQGVVDPASGRRDGAGPHVGPGPPGRDGREQAARWRAARRLIEWMDWCPGHRLGEADRGGRMSVTEPGSGWCGGGGPPSHASRVRLC